MKASRESPTKTLLKDQLFNRAKVEKLATEIARVYPSFDAGSFAREALERFPELELKARIAWIADCLKRHLPEDYRQAADAILRALPPPNDPRLTDGDFGDFIYAPYAEFVAQNGRARADLGFSLAALRQITMRFSAEDAIRYFLRDFPDETLKSLEKLSGDRHYHVRRLCSEGTRPTLPWSQKIGLPVTTAIPILDKLFADSTRYVVRSVANHLNDISKLDPDLAIATLARWKKSARQEPAEMDYLIRHALRSLIKAGHPRALRLIGVSDRAKLRLTALRVPAKVAMNSFLTFSLTIEAQETASLIVDYSFYFRNQAGELAGRKVFKLKTLRLAKGESIRLEKRHRLLETMTTRKLFRGGHALEIQINGKPYGKRAFRIV